MSFSLIKPELRPVFSIFTKLWLCLIGILFFIMLCVNLFVVYKNYSIKSNIQSMIKDEKKYSRDIVRVDNVFIKIKDEISVAKSINASNSILKQSLHNLFDLVPDSITLEEVLMDKTSLVIRGKTPTKDVFNQLLSSPLKSIFTTSNTSFYQIKNGWYGFVSTNKIDNSEGYNE